MSGDNNMMKISKERKHWIDCLRGFCCLIVIIDHAEVYLTGDRITNYCWYSTNALVTFFFLSGYLAYKASGFDYKKKVKALMKCILMPYFIFTSALSIPKALAHGNAIDLAGTASKIIEGGASWFVAALFVAELIFFTAIWLTKGNSAWLAAIAASCFAASALLVYADHPNYWQIENGLQGVLFLLAGYMYHKMEHKFETLRKPLYLCCLFAAFISIKIYETNIGYRSIICPIRISNYAIFLADIAIWYILAVGLFKSLPPCRPVEFCGTHSIIYYFFCGASPMAVSMLFHKCGLTYQGNYLLVLLASLCSYMLTSAIAWIIYHYCPILVGKTKSQVANL